MKVALGQQVAGYFANNEAPGLGDLRGRRGVGRAVLALPAGQRLRGEARLQGRRRRQRGRRRGVDHRRAVPPALRRRGAVGAPRHRVGRRLAHRAASSGPPGPTGFGARALLAWLGSPDPLEGIWHACTALTVRWSLADAPDGVEEQLASYVAETSHARFTGMEGLRFKTWRMRAGGVVRGLLRLRRRRRPGGVPGDASRPPPPSRRARRSSARRRS